MEDALIATILISYINIKVINVGLGACLGLGVLALAMLMKLTFLNILIIE
jgi:hypothetical protein